MLSIDQIIKFAKAPKLTKHILQEYFQYEILDSFCKQPGSLDYSFIGGTAVRLLYGGRRFSEDLDFDSVNLTNFDKILAQVISDMQAKGFDLEFRLIHKGAYHCYVKFPKILHTYGLSGYEEEKLLIKLDAAPISKLYTTVAPLSDYGVFCKIKAAPAPILLAKKLLTIGERKRPKGRDFYDITWLWGMGEPDLLYLKEVANQTLKGVISRVNDHVVGLDLPALAEETKQFLLNPDDINRILLFPDFIKQKLAAV